MQPPIPCRAGTHPHSPLSLSSPPQRQRIQSQTSKFESESSSSNLSQQEWKITSHLAVYSKEITNPRGEIPLCRAALAVTEQQTQTQPLAGASPSCEDKNRHPESRRRSQEQGILAGMREKTEQTPGERAGEAAQPFQQRADKREVREVSGTGAAGAPRELLGWERILQE